MKIRKAKTTFSEKLDKYLSIAQISLKEILYYPQKLRVTLILVPFRILVLLLIYQYTFNYIGRSVNGINANIAIWSISVYHILLFVQFRGIFRTINDEIRKGSIETQINKPYNFLIYKFWEHLGKGLPNLVISLFTVIPMLYLLTGFPTLNLSLLDVYAAMFLIIGGTLVSAALYILIVLPALWIDDATPIFWIVDKSILILGGAFIPLALLPQSFQTFANLTPFGAPMFATQMFYPDFSSRWPLLIAVQAFWATVLFALVSIVYSKAQQKLSVNGG